MNFNPDLTLPLAVVLATLVTGTIVGEIVSRTARGDKALRFAGNLRARVGSWWLMSGGFVVAVLLGGTVTVVLFAIGSFLALREFLTVIPTRRGDHRALFWAFFLILPAHYFFIGNGNYGMFTIFIPVYAFVLIPIRIALAGETEEYLARTARIQWGMMVCVYFLSHVPALLQLQLRDPDASTPALLFYLILIVQLNDVAQYTFGTLFGKRKVAPSVSPNKTLEGLIGGVLATVAVGVALHPVTPFSPLAAAALSFMVAVMGFLGDLVMSAVKRDLGVKDYSGAIPGHGGVLDRMDSLTFAAPVFFHVVGFFYQ